MHRCLATGGVLALLAVVQISCDDKCKSDGECGVNQVCEFGSCRDRVPEAKRDCGEIAANCGCYPDSSSAVAGQVRTATICASGQAQVQTCSTSCANGGTQYETICYCGTTSGGGGGNCPNGNCTCGNQKCDANESCASCPADCGVCQFTCGAADFMVQCPGPDQWEARDLFLKTATQVFKDEGR